MTKPRYPFTSCAQDYKAMPDESKEALHQLINAAGARFERDIEMWQRELLAAGWVRATSVLGRQLRNAWRAPDGSLHIGPYGAWRKMKAASEER